MKALKTLAIVAAFLGLTSGAIAQPVSEVVAVTDVSSAYTPGGRPTFVRFLNDGAGAVYVELDGTAVAGAAASTKINACEGREFSIKEGDVTVVSAVADSGQSASLRIDIGYGLSLPPSGQPTAADRAGKYVTNYGCSVATAIAVTDSELAALGGLTSAANKVPYFTGSGTAALGDMGANMRTFMTTSSSANLITLMSDETGTGAAVFANTPTLVTPVLGAATGTSLVLTGAVTAPSGVVLLANAGQAVSKSVTLTEAGAAEVVATFVTAAGTGYSINLEYMVFVGDATPDYAVRSGNVRLVCVNKATAVSCTKDATTQADDESVLISPATAKTLTYAIASDVATANTSKVTFDIDSDIAVVVGGKISWIATVTSNGAVTVS